MVDERAKTENADVDDWVPRREDGGVWSAAVEDRRVGVKLSSGDSENGGVGSGLRPLSDESSEFKPSY